MNKKLLALVLAGCVCVPTAWGYTCVDRPASALTLIAYIMDVTVKKDVIAVGESVQLELQWSNGATQEVFYTSSDESVLQVDPSGVVTGISDGTAEISVATASGTAAKTITISVSSDVRESAYYNTSELSLGMKLYQYDTLHYDDKNIGSVANIINAEGSYDLAFISEKDYVLPFDAEVVGFDGLTLYLAPELAGVTYIDGRTLTEGDVIATESHLLCYDYHINNRTLPVFLPSYYAQIVGEGEIRVKSIDHEQKIIELEAVAETVTAPSGDVNADGELGIVDIILMQKWLLAVDVTMTDWQAGDLCDDDILNAFDLELMKRTLISVEVESKPAFSVAEGLFDQGNTDTLSLAYPEGLETYTVWKAEEEGDHYCNGVCLTAFQGKLYCQWQSSAKDEDSSDTRVMYAVSSDMGKTWSEPQQLVQDIAVEGVTGDETAYCSSGGWLATEDQLVAYINVWPGIDPRGGYTYYMTSQDGINWSDPQPVMMADGTPMNAIFEQDPHVLESGRIINSAHFQEGLVVYPIYTDDPNGITGWKKGDFTPTVSGSTSVEMEPSLFVQADGTVVMIFRDQNSSYTKFASYSEDEGATWSKVQATDMPDARTKQSAGNLSDGTAFMVGCPVNNKLRSPLAVTLSADGETFDHAYLIRSTSSDPELVYEGTAKRLGFHYTKSYVYDGYLFVGYATNKEAVEVSVIPESSLMLN